MNRRSLKVLLVDDSEAVRLTLGTILEMEGYTVHLAGSIGEVRALYLRGEFDVAILDLHLTDGLGTELISGVRRAHPNAVIAMLSGMIDSASKIAGADLVIEKGNNPESLIQRLENAVAERRKETR